MLQRTPAALAVGVVAIAITGCGSSARRTAAFESSSHSQTDQGSCSPAPLHKGSPPSWAAAAQVTTPYALASGKSAAAFYFAYPLRAGHPTNPTNKILWVMRWPREGKPLNITARSDADPEQVIRIQQPANSGPGEIYPSRIDLPKPGCWELALRWASHTTRIDVQVRARDTPIQRIAARPAVSRFA